ncbi:MAG: hypothetical protein ABI618_05920, partial [Nitrospirota bacterium]
MTRTPSHPNKSILRRRQNIHVTKTTVGIALAALLMGVACSHHPHETNSSTLPDLDDPILVQDETVDIPLSQCTASNTVTAKVVALEQV